MAHPSYITRDISWLAFNERVLQEAADPSVPLYERIRFLGIFSNNLDEFFRVRVATLRRMDMLGRAARMHLEAKPKEILSQIQERVLEQQTRFSHIWTELTEQMRTLGIQLRNERQLTRVQQRFVLEYFNQQLRPNIIPLMIQSIARMPDLRDKSIYLAVVLSHHDRPLEKTFSLIEVPTAVLPRFIELPCSEGQHHIILLEDIIRYCLPQIFSLFDYNHYAASIIKLTRDAELDFDNDIDLDQIGQLQKSLKNRKKGKPVRLVFDREIDTQLLAYLVQRLNLSGKDNLIAGDRIHNFKDFMRFPASVFPKSCLSQRRKPIVHPCLRQARSVQEVVLQRDVLLSFPYHDFSALIDMLREAAIDPEVQSIKITLYRVAENSRIIHALVNAARNGKQVSVVLELRARFDEEANLRWKALLEEEGVQVFIGIPNMKVHAKLGLIRKRTAAGILHYGFVSTGNLNEDTARYYSDECLLTAHPDLMADVHRLFQYLEDPEHPKKYLDTCRMLIPSPGLMREALLRKIDREIKHARKSKPAGVLVKLNSLSDQVLIAKLYEAARAGVEVRLIIRGICCAITENPKWKRQIQAISIVDEYLEHARILVFHNLGKPDLYISSADWMVRNLDHRVEVAAPVLDKRLREDLLDLLEIQWQDRVKARILDNEQQNRYFRPGKLPQRSQLMLYRYFQQKTDRP